ncbi:MAG: ATP-binding protein [Cyanobacteria bacterium]|nr:ATP-binding protein [Cyanobacteriota bacterium]
MAEVLANLEAKIEGSSAILEIDELPKIEAIETQMLQVFQNLISNAIKYQKPDSRPKVQVKVKSNKNNYEITISDNGIGFEQEQADKIFEQFYRLHNKNSHYQGTGIGLAICHRIVDKHHGKILATSEPGKGSSFVVTLPLKQPKREVGLVKTL